MDPCGAFVDLIRRPYTTQCRFFRDSTTEVDISWYPCKPDAPAIDTPSVISSLDWWVQERELGVYSGYKVGEVPGAARKWNGLKVKPRADGLHRCGTEDEWANGALLDTSLRRPRRGDGLPACCGGVPAGVVIGGRAGGRLPYVPGVVVGGTAAVQRYFAVPHCYDGPIFLVPPNGIVSLAGSNPEGAPYTSLTLHVQLHGIGFSTQGYYFGARPGGTATLVRWTITAPCADGEVLYSGPSDAPFAFSCPDLPSPHGGYYILVDTDPDVTGKLLIYSETFTP